MDTYPRRLAFCLPRWPLWGAVLLAVTPLFAQTGLRAGGKDAGQTFKEPKVVALVQAIEREDLPAIDLAIQRGASINAVGEEGQTPLHWSLLKVGIAGKTVQHLLERGADPNAPMHSGKSPLFLTSGGNRPDLLELFLQHKGDPNVLSRTNETPLMNAIASQYEANVRLLLKYGADPNLGETCLSTVGNARFDFTAELLRNGLTKDLPRCGRLVLKRVIPVDSSQQVRRAKVFELLAERGVVPPFGGR